jgi:hypothetical protein
MTTTTSDVLTASLTTRKSALKKGESEKLRVSNNLSVRIIEPEKRPMAPSSSSKLPSELHVIEDGTIITPENLSQCFSPSYQPRHKDVILQYRNEKLHCIATSIDFEILIHSLVSRYILSARSTRGVLVDIFLRKFAKRGGRFIVYQNDWRQATAKEARHFVASQLKTAAREVLCAVRQRRHRRLSSNKQAISTASVHNSTDSKSLLRVKFKRPKASTSKSMLSQGTKPTP